MRVVEHGQRAKGDHQLRRRAAKMQRHAKAFRHAVHKQIVKLVLQDNGDFLRVFRLEVPWDRNTRMICPVAQIKMMLPRHAVFGGMFQGAPGDFAHRGFGPGFIGKQAFGRGGFLAHAAQVLEPFARPGKSGGLLLPGAPRAALTC